MNRLVSISEAAKLLGVSVSTLRRRELTGNIEPEERNEGSHRRYDISKIKSCSFRKSFSSGKTIAYARVSSRDQKKDLARQRELLELYCASQGWTFEVMSDLGSGMNYSKKGLKRLLEEILAGKIDRLVITHKDRLLRFGAELIFAICEAKEVEVVILNKGEEGKFEEELAKDVLEIITVFSARLYGSRSKKTKKLIEEMKRVADENTST
ncbi:MAG TPA: IS607 family transposase [Gammaproteobacteria bacterium]|jgi:predicted site-specific integrase-resolvase|nr:IS607 family transposase [Gammaproteobacteria bacterium]